MYCKWCDGGDEPAVLDIDGVLSSLSGKPGMWAHVYTTYLWIGRPLPCPRKAAELRALEVLAIAWIRAETAMVVAIELQGDNPIPDGSAADLAVERWDQVDDKFRAACRELSKAADAGECPIEPRTKKEEVDARKPRA